jgi:PAS domain S-box-containing protein
MGKNLTYEDLESAFQTLKSELAGYKRKEAHAKAIFDTFMKVAKRLRSGIYRFDVQKRKFLFFNRAAIDLLGSEKAEAKEVTSKSVLLRIHPKDRQKVRKAARDSIASGMIDGEAEYRYRRADGTYGWNYDRWVVLRDDTGQPRYIEGIVMDTTERKLAEQALLESERKLRLLSSHLLEAQEKERRRIASELHDELGQALTVLKLQLRNIIKMIPTDPWRTKTDCQNANDYVDQIIENVRRLSQDLCPSYLEDFGLDDSIKMIADDFAKHTQIKVSISGQKIDRLFPLESRILIYRIFQEALTNIQKHSQAKVVSILIQKNDSRINFQLSDDGKGFIGKPKEKTDSIHRGLGMKTMEERVRILGGELVVSSSVGIGTRIAFSIPFHEVKINHGFL